MRGPDWKASDGLRRTKPAPTLAARDKSDRRVIVRLRCSVAGFVLFRYVERRVRDHAHDRSVTGRQPNLTTVDRGGWQNLNGSSDLGSGRVGLNVRDLDVRICLTEAATRPPTHHAATHVGPREYELDTDRNSTRLNSS